MKLFIIALFVFSSTSLAQTSVWKVSKDNHHIFLGGTIHVLAKSDYPLPVEFDKAYTASERLVFETDMQELNSPSLQQEMIARLSYPGGKTLRSDLTFSTYRNLERHCQKAGLPLATLKSFKPQMVSLMITIAELQRLGLANAGVDEFYTEKARNDGKPIEQFETASEQLDFIVNMGKGQEDQLIRHTLKEVQDLPRIMSTMKSTWRHGDSNGLYQSAVVPMKQAFPSIYKDLLVERNNNWMPEIERMLTNKEVEYVLVGAAHLVGPDGLIKQLQKKGYKIEQL